jgi:tRNA(fMet)-specific endonuclease VapC
MNYLLDTDICIYWLRGNAKIREHLVVVGPQSVAVSTITLAELRYGAACSARAEDNHNAIDDFVSGLTILELTTGVARQFGGIKALLRAQGNLIEDFDLLLAATAIEYDLTLVTNNTAHFDRVPRLKLVNWLPK